MSFYRTSDTENKTDVDMLNMAFVILASLWFLCVLAFLRVTNSDFWHTFFSTVTGWQFTVDSYSKSDDPETKMLTIFENHSSFTEIIKSDVIVYMHANWAEWERTQPAWFTPKFISGVGDEYIPGRALRRMSDAFGGERPRMKATRLSSMKEIIITLSTADLIR